MCLHRSFVVAEDMTVYDCPNSDHHTDIVEKYRLTEKLKEQKDPVFVECRPEITLWSLDGWNTIFDNTTGEPPKWWTKEHHLKMGARLEEQFHKYQAIDSTYIFPGELNLTKLQCLRHSGCTIVAKGVILLDSLGVIPPDTTIISKAGISIRNVNRIYENCILSAPRFDAPRVFDGDRVAFVDTSRRGPRCDLYNKGMSDDIYRYMKSQASAKFTM